MTGYEGMNFTAFNEAQKKLENVGFEVLNPVRQEHGLTQNKYRELGVIDVLNSEGVAVLPGWTASRGAKLETTVATETGRPVLTVEQWLEQEVSWRV